MKKFHLMILAAAATLSAQAQQLPNNDFEGTWETCYPWVPTSSTNTANKNTNKPQGTQPQGWHASNTYGTDGSTGSKQLIYQVTGNGSSKAVKMANEEMKVLFVTSIVPGYFTLGTPWSTSVMNKSNDGGTFGGMAFTYRPDAIAFSYQSTGASDRPTVLAYSWKGTYSQPNVPANIVAVGSATKITMVDRDRNILAMSTPQGGTVNQTGTRISLLNQRLNAEQSTWADVTFPFEYSSTDTPEKFNVVFAAGDYFNATPVKDNSLTIDNIKLLYYSRLSGLTVNGEALDGFNSNTYSYDLSASVEMPESADVFGFSFLGTSGSQRASVALDAANCTATVTVTNVNADGTDVDGLTSHTYTIKFKAPEKPEQPEKPVYGGDTYAGIVTIKPIEGLSEEDMNINGEVHIIADEANPGTCTFVLPDFSLGEGATIGDILVENVTMATDAEGKTTYTGEKKGLKLYLEGIGDIVANVTLTGWTDADGNAHMDIDVLWLGDPENDPEGETNSIPITVEFNTKPVYGGDVYDGIVTLKQNETIGVTEDLNLDGQVHIIADAADPAKCTIVLPDFSLGEGATIGDIVVNDVTITDNGASKQYSGYTKALKLSFGGMEITAAITLTGYTQGEDAHMNIQVLWYDPAENPDADPSNGIPIEVEFNGKRIITGIAPITPDDDIDAPLEIYNIQGMRVANTNLAPGIYIVRQGKKVTKVLVK